MRNKKPFREQVEDISTSLREEKWEKEEKNKDAIRYAVRGSSQIVENIATLQEAQRVAEGINGKIWATIYEDDKLYYIYPPKNEKS